MVTCLMHQHRQVGKVYTSPLIFCPSGQILSSQQVFYLVEDYKQHCFICVTCIMQSIFRQFFQQLRCFPLIHCFLVYNFVLSRYCLTDVLLPSELFCLATGIGTIYESTSKVHACSTAFSFEIIASDESHNIILLTF
jgi:hypothetical protein